MLLLLLSLLAAAAAASTSLGPKTTMTTSTLQLLLAHLTSVLRLRNVVLVSQNVGAKLLTARGDRTVKVLLGSGGGLDLMRLAEREESLVLDTAGMTREELRHLLQENAADLGLRGVASVIVLNSKSDLNYSALPPFSIHQVRRVIL